MAPSHWPRGAARVDDIAFLIEASRKSIEGRGEGGGLTLVEWASAVLYNALGRYAEAVVAAEQASSHPEELGLGVWALPELVEAAVRNEEPDRAAAALERLSDAAQASGTDWALGVEARSRALLSAGRRCRSPLPEGYRPSRSHPCSRRLRPRAPCLRRMATPSEAPARRSRTLTVAHETVYGDGARRLRRADCPGTAAAGGTAAATGQHSRRALTSQEAQVARLARDGLSNAEIGNRLFISPRTVEYHLRKVYTKLDITSRTALPRIL